MTEHFLKGKKTHIANAIRAGAMLAGMIGYTINPEAVIQWVDELIAVLIAFEGLMAIAVSWFRELGKRG